jgi:hypothetical protein
MKYKYGVVGKSTCKDGIIVKAPALISLLKKEVDSGKWNIYEGGDDNHPAKISFKGKSFEYGEHMFVYGSEREIRFFEEAISKFIKVIPRVFA